MTDRSGKRVRPWLWAAVVMIAALGACTGDGALPRDVEDGLYARISTEKGQILIDLAYKEVPMTVMNFVGLAEGVLGSTDGEPFFDGLSFHRVEAGMVVQGGDPTGSGTGGPGYIFPDEISPALSHRQPGAISMANVGADTNGSQFFITMQPMSFLDGKHSVFGYVVEGMEVVESLRPNDTIEEVRIHRVGTDAKDFDVNQEAFDRLVETAWDESDQRKEAEAQTVALQIRQVVEDVSTTDSGLMYKIIRPGNGPPPETGTEVQVRFTAMLLDGTVIDSTGLRGGTPSLFKIGGGIEAWNEAIPQMQKGEIRVLFVPPNLAYGRMGHEDVIPPDSFLVFEIELVDF